MRSVVCSALLASLRRHLRPNSLEHAIVENVVINMTLQSERGAPQTTIEQLEMVASRRLARLFCGLCFDVSRQPTTRYNCAITNLAPQEAGCLLALLPLLLVNRDGRSARLSGTSMVASLSVCVIIRWPLELDRGSGVGCCARCLPCISLVMRRDIES